MGRAKKDSELKPSDVPGPGYYKIKGFAETLVEEVAKRKRPVKEDKESRKNLSRDQWFEEGNLSQNEKNSDFDNSLNLNREEAEN